ncbi:response regulator [bacterium]|nr:response regulator [bacterium]
MSSVKNKILIVEDDKFLRDLLARKLIKEGYEISVAVDGEEALRKVKEEKPNLILLDLILPGIGGFDVLAQIKKDAELAEIPVIILSNLGQKDDIEKGLKLGAMDYLIKAHFAPGEIIEKIKKVIR